MRDGREERADSATPADGKRQTLQCPVVVQPELFLFRSTARQAESHVTSCFNISLADLGKEHAPINEAF